VVWVATSVVDVVVVKGIVVCVLLVKQFDCGMF